MKTDTPTVGADTPAEAPTMPNGSGALAPRAGAALALPDSPSVEWLNAALNPSQIETLVKTVAPRATPDELAVFFWTCRRRGLDPFLKQIHFVKRRRWNKEIPNAQQPGKMGDYEEYAVHQTGIDGFRVIAGRAKDDGGKRLHAGTEVGPVRDDKGLLVGAWAEVYRHDWIKPARRELLFTEYVQMYDGKPQGLWSGKPQMMLEKCAEAATLRVAFPEDLGDLFIHEEMDSAEHIRPLNRPEPEPLSSTAVVTQPELLDRDRQPVVVATPPTGPLAPAPNGTGSLFDEAEEPDVHDPRHAMLDVITASKAKFTPQPKPETWARMVRHFCRVDDLVADGLKVDPTLLTAFTKFLDGLHVGDAEAVKTLRAISPRKAAS